MYEQNAALLKEVNKSLYYQIKDVPIDENKYEVRETKTGVPTIKLNSMGKELYLHSRYNPTREADLYADEQYDSHITEYIVIGFGFGYHIQSLVKKNRNIRLYILENDPVVFKMALENVNLRNIVGNSAVTIILEKEPEQFLRILEKLVSSPGRKLLTYLPSIQAMGESFTDVKYLLEEYRINRRAADSMSILESNFYENVKNYQAYVDCIFGAYRDIPIFIVSAGPSLDKNVELLKLVKDKGLVISVGKAVKALVQAEVQPDFIVVSDAGDSIYSDQLKNVDIDVPIIALSTCDKSIMKHYNGYKLIAFQKEFQLSEEYAKEKGLQLINTGGSVATTALDIALRLGGNPIVFVGQDLALTDGRSHAKGIPSSRAIEYTNSLRQVEGIYGNPVYTTKSLYMFLKWIENRIAKEPEVSFIDGTEGGARIKGTEIMNLQEVMDKYLSNSGIKINKSILWD